MLERRPAQGGKIIFLHGASSSGKSTLARALQAALDEPFWHLSIDHLRDSGVLPMTRIRKGDFRWAEMRTGFFNGYHRSLAAYAHEGNNLIIEHILDSPDWLDDLVGLLASFDVFFVGVHCSLPELRRREAARGDREAGSADKDFHTIHRNRRYDLEINAERPLEGNVERLIDAWAARKSPSVFAGLALVR